jgi:membrane fusion protein, multidrug efflux system
VIAGVVAVYYMPPQWQQTQAASKGGRRGGPAAATDPVPVLVTAARTAAVPVYLDGVGTAKALNTVTVRSQVDGKLISVLFTEGQDVPKGFVLAKIDPTTYQAQYDQVVAKKAQDEALLANARLDLERYTRLAATNAVNKQQLDTQAMVAQLEAQLQLDQGSTMRVPSCPIPTSWRRSPAAPASVRSTKATWCARPSCCRCRRCRRWTIQVTPPAAGREPPSPSAR